jgi:hypothetical protein
MRPWMLPAVSTTYAFLGICDIYCLIKNITSWQRIAKQLAQTDALLNKYVEILCRTEDVARLIFDEDWQGAEAVS